jgi:antitoxin HigA-1
MGTYSSKNGQLPTRPGEVLRDEFLREHEITQEALAQAIGMSRLTINQLINGKRAITAETALRLGRAMGTSAEFWMNLQRTFDLREAELRIGNSLNQIKTLIGASSKTGFVFEMPPEKKAAKSK